MGTTKKRGSLAFLGAENLSGNQAENHRHCARNGYGSSVGMDGQTKIATAVGA